MKKIIVTEQNLRDEIKIIAQFLKGGENKTVRRIIIEKEYVLYPIDPMKIEEYINQAFMVDVFKECDNFILSVDILASLRIAYLSFDTQNDNEDRECLDLLFGGKIYMDSKSFTYLAPDVSDDDDDYRRIYLITEE